MQRRTMAEGSEMDEAMQEAVDVGSVLASQDLEHAEDMLSMYVPSATSNGNAAVAVHQDAPP